MKASQLQQEYIEKLEELVAFLDDCNFSTTVSKDEWLKRKQLYDELASLKSLVEKEPEITDEKIERWMCEDTPAGPDAANVMYWKIFGAKWMRDKLLNKTL